MPGRQHAMVIQAVVVDDETPARARVRTLARNHHDVAIVAEASDPQEALAAIAAHQPDVIFVDVEMPGMSGVEIVRRIPPGERPLVVFMTALPQYAVEAFALGAVHYLLKPLAREDVDAALQRVRQAMSDRAATATLAQLMSGFSEAHAPLQRVIVKRNGRAMLMRVRDIDWIESAGNYSRIHAGGVSHLLREGMASLETKLDRHQFLRIHRSTVVNLDRIRELHAMSHGDYAVILHDDTQLSLSRRYRSRFEMLFGRL